MSTRKTDADLLQYARQMRHEMTRQERRLWFDFFKALPHTVRRQKVFGSYIADFYIASHKLVIELDGSQHYEAAAQEYDTRRDAYLRSLGLTVLRYANVDVDHDFRGVCEDILQHLK
ncbi:MAG: endonuclease domain-containing protein [Oscillospiraceae bacterium]|nr:endonuclease domain-containing protein [Oscillospiraceae bacterium]